MPSFDGIAFFVLIILNCI